MRQAKTDKYVCFIMLVIFFYSFFLIGTSPIYCKEQNGICRDGEVIGIQWSTAVFISPVAFLMFFFFMLFHKELAPVNRRFVKYHIKKGFKWTRWKIKKGLDDYKEWKS